MKKYALVLIFIISISIFSQWEWSEPLQISEYGNYPETWYSYPAITIDNNGNLYAFWIKGIQIDSELSWYNQIECSFSNDNGINWTIPKNLTPEYTNSRIDDISAVADSNSNIHLFYTRRNGGASDVLYKKFNGSMWTDPELVGDLAITSLRTGIDSEDRIYLTWFGGDTAYYTYCDQIGEQQVWSKVLPISSKGYSIRSFFDFDKDNNLYCVGKSMDPIYSYFFKYNKFSGEWTFEKMFDFSSLACGITISNDNIFYSNISVGPTNSDNISYITNKTVSDTLWSDIEEIGENNDFRYKEMFIDSSDVIHLFEMHYGDKSCLSYTSNLGIWITDIFCMDSFYTYGNFDVCFDKIDNFYITYTEGNPDTHSGAVFFQTKRIDTSISNNDQLVVQDYELSQNYPNPFNPMTTIEFGLPKDQDVNLSVYNSKGELIDVFLNQKLHQGKHKVTYYSRNLKSGVYFYTLKTEEKKITKKMVFVK
ncbi:MAG: T9SS type A sorting domain-containing protein [Candidatus Delongbacteria bacterium]|jgi:hypothetical protein|nr:T9SS type A sorting domain-containing protein [Candidatus Delongbacteria bacterium]